MEVTIRPHVILLGLTVGIALADSSVVTLALPRILADYDVSIGQLSGALPSYNRAPALAAVPAAFLARRQPTLVFAVGILVFACASLLCAFAPTIEVLIAARAVQGMAGAAGGWAFLDLLSQAAGGGGAPRPPGGR